MSEQTQEESMKIFDLVIRENLLPANIEALVPLSFIGNAAIDYYKAKIKMMDSLKMTEEQREATLVDGQEAGDLLLDIESRIGELLETLPKSRIIIDKNNSEEGNRIKKGELSKIGLEGAEGIKKAFQARIIKNNPKIVEEIKKEARVNDDIPTKTAVLKAVRIKQMERKQAEYNTKPADPKPDINLELFKISESIGGLMGRINRMDGFQDSLKEEFCTVIIDNCKRIIEVLGGTE